MSVIGAKPATPGSQSEIKGMVPNVDLAPKHDSGLDLLALIQTRAIRSENSSNSYQWQSIKLSDDSRIISSTDLV